MPEKLNLPLLEVDNLSVSFGTGEHFFKAVDNVSFRILPGETLGIVGESGSGKSVTSLSLMQLIAQPAGRIESGTARIQTKNHGTVDLLSLSQKEIRKFRGNDIAMIFQEPMTSLNPVFTCGHQVAEALKLHKNLSGRAAREETIHLFEKVKLPRPAEMFDAYPHQISGGQKQRVMIAMAISCQPRILIADEPTTALDVTVQATILDLLKELQEETGMGMIFITHDLGVISRIANEVVVMYKGKSVEKTDVKSIFHHPKHPYTKGLLACRPANNTGLKRLPVISDFMVADDSGNYSETGRSIEEIIAQLKVNEASAPKKVQEQKSTTPLLSVQQLQTYFPLKKSFFGKPRGEVKAVDTVSFEVFPGETLGLVGESGCGKTTLGRSILRLIEPTGGSILYRGDDIRSFEKTKLRAFRKQMQLIFQDPYSSLNPRLTAGAAIREPMYVHGLYKDDKERKEMVMQLLKKVGLKEEHYFRYPHQFSGGQRQRICIARALSLNPEFVICDESVSALDVSVQAQVLNLLNELKEEQGLTYIFISHDLSVVRFMSDRIMVMNKGRIEELGDADEVYLHPKSDYTRKLIEAIPH
ncbi:MAG: ABC transporter ATP-binding protein [Bacteroidetes bacterium]|nr:ABC transporter ATP-binding protein [Bacteroidota bacterium]